MSSSSTAQPPDGLAVELMRNLERRAALDPGDGRPYKVTVLDTRADGNQFTVIYRQEWSPQLLGRRGDAADFTEMFEPQQTPDRLAAILLQGMSEPSGEGHSGPASWAAGIVPDPAAVRWFGT